MDEQARVSLQIRMTPKRGAQRSSRRTVRRISAVTRSGGYSVHRARFHDEKTGQKALVAVIVLPPGVGQAPAVSGWWAGLRSAARARSVSIVSWTSCANLALGNSRWIASPMRIACAQSREVTAAVN